MQSSSSELVEVPPFVDEVTLVGLPMEEEPAHNIVMVAEEDKVGTSHDHCYGGVSVDNISTGIDASHDSVSTENDKLQESAVRNVALQDSPTKNNALQESSPENKELQATPSGCNAFQDSPKGNNALQDSSTGNAVEDISKGNDMMQDSSPAGNNALQDSSPAGNNALQDSSPAGNNALQDSSPAENNALQDSSPAGNNALQDSSPAGNNALQDSSTGNNALQDNSTGNAVEDTGSSKGNDVVQDSSPTGNYVTQDSSLTRNDALQDCTSLADDVALEDTDHVGQHCSVEGCTSVQNEAGDLTFYDLPTDPERRLAWLSALNTTSSSLRVCGKHFISGSASDDPQSPDYVPSRLLNGLQCKKELKFCKAKAGLQGKVKVGNISKSKTGHVDKNQRVGRAKMRRTTCFQQKIAAWRKLKTLTSELKDMDVDTSTSDSRMENEQSTRENKLILINTLIQSKTFAKQSLELDSLKDEDQKVEVLTGFKCYATMASVFNIVRSYIAHKAPMSNFDQFMVFCMRLRLNLSIDHLASIFNASPATICHAFSDVLEVMNKRIVDGLLLWPDKDLAKLAVSTLFREQLGKSPYFIECKDILIEKPSNAFSQKQTYSKSKCHYSMKYFLCLTSQGTVCYLSKGWGGGTSDKYVAENCGFLQKLMPGDVVLSDPHFNNYEVIKTQGEGVKIPAFTKGRHRLLPLDIGKFRTNTSLQERVEQVLGLTRFKYLMLESVMPISFLMAIDEEYTKLDKLMRVVCALTNLCNFIES